MKANKLNKAIVLFAMLIVSISCSPANGKEHKARYPSELIGVWQGDDVTCTLPGNLDSDTRMEIKPDRLIDYEQWNDPLIVMQISKQPKAWKIKSRLNIDDHVYDQYEIFVLSGSDKGTLTVIDKSRSATYARCK